METRPSLRKLFSRVLFVVLSLAIIASATACSSPAATPTPQPAAAKATEAPTARPPAPPASTSAPAAPTATPRPTSTPLPPQPATGQGTLNLAGTAPVTLDPATAAEVGSASYIVQIFGGLLRLDDNLNVAPDIAESWDRSADGRTFTFHIRRDAKFHDGKQVKASDFKYSWERALNPATRSLTAGSYLNDIVGSMDVLTGKSRTLSGVTAQDDYTLVVKIDAPKGYFLDKMAYPTAFVVDQANVNSGSQWWQKPNGTGPFKLKQWTRDQSLVLQRNDGYYGERARLAQVVYKLLSGNPLQLYQNGEIDVASVSAQYMGWATDPANPASKELNLFPELSFSYIGFNASAPPFDDPNVRRAFSYAVDKERIAALSLQNTVAPANGILPPGMPGYNEALQGLRFDPAKAKQALAASRYGDASKLPPIVITTYGWGNQITGVLGGVIDQWRRNLGVEVTVRQLEPEIYQYMLNEEKDQMFENGWIADYPDPQDFLDILFRTGSQNNSGDYSNKQLDALLDKAAAEQDQSLRMKMYQDIEKLIVEDAATLPLFFSRNYELVKPYVKGYKVSPLGYPLLYKVSIQK